MTLLLLLPSQNESRFCMSSRMRAENFFIHFYGKTCGELMTECDEDVDEDDQVGKRSGAIYLVFG